MRAVSFTKGLAVALTMANAVIWTYQGHWIAGICIAVVAILVARYLPEE